MDVEGLEKFYTFIYDLKFSRCGKYLAASDNFGYISVFSLSKVLDSSAVDSSRTPHRKFFTGARSPIFCLENNGSHLFSGGCDGVKGWRWKAITGPHKEDLKPDILFTPPSSNTHNIFSDVNALAYNEVNKLLFLASGCNVYALDLATESVKYTYTGHTKYIHSISHRTGKNQFFTASEDGTVKLWDISNQSTIQSVAPVVGKSGKEAGQWVSCVAVDSSGEWMACGGSSAPSVYKIASMSKSVTLEFPPKVTTQTILFTANRIITGGSESNIRHWAMNGDSISSVPSSLTHIFSIRHNTANPQYEVLAVSGDSSEIDIFTHFGYRSFSLSSYC